MGKIGIKRGKGSGYLVRERVFVGLCLGAVLLPVLMLVSLLARLVVDGAPRLDMDFLSSFPSRKAALAGILPSAVGTLYLVVLTAIIAMPIGVGAAVYLEEYGKKSKLATLIEINIANL